MPRIDCGHIEPEVQGRRGDEEVVRVRLVACRLHGHPDGSVAAGDGEVEVYHFNRGKILFNPEGADGPVLRRGSLHAMQQLCGSDGCHVRRLLGMGSEEGSQIESLSFLPDEERTVDN